MTEPKQTEIASLEPRTVWSIFEEMAAVPRCSKHEEAIRAWARSFAEKHGFPSREDAVGNVVISVPASKGCEKARPIVIQGHLDMVCEKNRDTEFDFATQGIRLLIDDENGEPIVRADGTTLGADNGMGVALGMAAAITPDVKHGPLELLLTIDEEAGMTGAKALEADFVAGRTLLNLDSEEDDLLYIGCAGGCDTALRWELPASGPAEETCQVSVRGLRGGHSGGDIHKGFGAATRILLRTLKYAAASGLRVGCLTAGTKRNAIAREAEAIVTGPKGMIDKLKATGAQAEAECRDESMEPNASVIVEPADSGACSAFAGPEDSARLLDGLMGLPHGVIGMHPKLPGLVETSNNVAIFETTGGGNAITVEARLLTRSSSSSRIHEALEQINAVARLAGAKILQDNAYPGWAPNPDSEVLATCRRVYEECFGEDPEVAAIHAGLECGLIGKRIPGMDMVSFGPHIEGAHSPDERVYIRSVEKIWKYLGRVLETLAKEQ